MPLSDKTLAEMEAGALALANQHGENALPPGYMEAMTGYMEAMIRRQERHRLLKAWEKEGKITVERVMRPTRVNPEAIQMMTSYNLIHCGDVIFDDVDAESRGAYPSEVLIANIALAISSGQCNKPQAWYSGATDPIGFTACA
jgi:hypothetical protein